MEFAIFNIFVLLVIVVWQRARYNALTEHQARRIAELEHDCNFWIGEAEYHAKQLGKKIRTDKLGK
jgi:hypothetical protein